MGLKITITTPAPSVKLSTSEQKVVLFSPVIQGPKGDTGPAGPQGNAGPTGPQGAIGPGVPAGGSSGQILAKASAADYAGEWIDPPSGGAIWKNVSGIISFSGSLSITGLNASRYRLEIIRSYLFASSSYDQTLHLYLKKNGLAQVALSAGRQTEYPSTIDTPFSSKGAYTTLTGVINSSYTLAGVMDLDLSSDYYQDKATFFL